MATDFKPVIKEITDAIEAFQATVPAAQQAMLDEILDDLNGLKLNGRNIAVSVANVKKISAIKAKLQKLVLNDEYKKAVKKYLKTFDQVTTLQDAYFVTLEAKYKPSKLGAEMQKQAITTVAQDLTERGIDANVVSAVEDILRTSITTGGPLADLRAQLTNAITTNDAGPGLLERYTKQITTDALNQHSAQYTQTVAASLGLKWFRYTGSLIETSRPFCIACRDKEWIHESEFADVIAGNFPEFADAGGKIYDKTGLPEGMIPDTTPDNFPIYRGGWNCAHQLRPVPDSQVPQAVRDALKNRQI